VVCKVRGLDPEGVGDFATPGLSVEADIVDGVMMHTGASVCHLIFNILQSTAMRVPLAVPDG
jgi:hypothetical protein